MLSSQPIGVKTRTQLKVLFVCSRNQWRSPTAEVLFRRDDRVEARSAGTVASAKRRINERDIEWADLILVMERKHAATLRRQFPHIDKAALHILDVPDEYKFMDEELVELIRLAAEPLIGRRAR